MQKEEMTPNLSGDLGICQKFCQRCGIHGLEKGPGGGDATSWNESI